MRFTVDQMIAAFIFGAVFAGVISMFAYERKVKRLKSLVKRADQLLSATRMFLRNVYADNGAKDEEFYLKNVVMMYMRERKSTVD